MKKLFLSLVLILVSLTWLPKLTLAQEINNEINFFYSESCPHCAQEKSFLQKTEKEGCDLKINYYSLAQSENVDLLKSFYQQYNVPQNIHGLVPITFIQDEYLLGFGQTTQINLQNKIDYLTDQQQESNTECQDDDENDIHLPIIGHIDIEKYSLPILAVMFGFFDGFNVCSLGALVFILGLVLTLKSRKKIFGLGLTFILTTAILYGLLIGFWYKLFNILGNYLRSMEVVIGCLGLIGGIYLIYQFIRMLKYGPNCGMSQAMTKISTKLKSAFTQPSRTLSLVGAIIVFAGVITLIEFPCSAALPLFYAGLLSQANLTALSYVLCITLFVFFYMLDEIVIFVIAVFTMKIRLGSQKFVVWITLIEAILLLGLGFYYLIGIN
ncbi:MAG: hypothetical protein PHS07_02835 [Patescibacteria group bacterium]|nr:hypothetical protein [Patescibacteria group bacterium]